MSRKLDLRVCTNTLTLFTLFYFTLPLQASLANQSFANAFFFSQFVIFSLLSLSFSLPINQLPD